MSDNDETSSREEQPKESLSTDDQTPEITQPIKLQTGVTMDSFDISKNPLILNENEE